MTNVLRVPKLDLQTILAQQNPHIDLKIEAYEASTRNFLAAVSNYTQRALTEISNRKNTFVAEKNKFAERTQHVENETNACKVKELELMAVLEKEREERKEAELAVAGLERQLGSIKEQCSLLDIEIEQRRVVVNNLQRERDRERSLLNNYAAKTSPELAECEDSLKCVIEGIDKDKILVRFAYVDDLDPQREFSLVIDVSSSSYKVPTTSPFLPTLPILLDELNETKDVYGFIKQARQAFHQLISQ